MKTGYKSSSNNCLCRSYLKLNLEFPEYSKGFRWILRARCGYKIDARVAKAAKMINNSPLLRTCTSIHLECSEEGKCLSIHGDVKGIL
ncbi:hypothetical protein BCR32DRAFT_280095 [Anaeromyces robustus]|uniref:Uncharacterized protein n=1 Tax=Anaeromyces robustus TaxID=1754192 RepID=A0A1Y1X6Q3_9FUNG|nr:hypothetical protein BCR32DRAFT_280095 [Anaeromyces robustus]|eukprot:ORX80984.1 hypothetical protein BCR32DRAFT_280095 [Anaeromyces robustus]